MTETITLKNIDTMELLFALKDRAQNQFRFRRSHPLFRDHARLAIDAYYQVYAATHAYMRTMKRSKLALIVLLLAMQRRQQP